MRQHSRLVMRRAKGSGVILATGCAVVLGISLTGCGSATTTDGSTTTTSGSAATTGGSTTTTSGSGAATTAPASPTSYDGPTASLPDSWPAPSKVAGTVKIGYLQITSEQVSLVHEQAGAAARARQLGVQLIVKDCQLSPQTQTAQFQQLLEQGVKAIIVYPVVPSSLEPELAAAKKAGVAVIGDDADPAVTTPLISGYTADLEEPSDRAAFALAQAAAKFQPHAQIGIIGTALPIAILKNLILRERYWAQVFGLKLDAEADDQQDTPAGYQVAANQLLSDHPGIQQIWTYSELVALTVASVVHASGHQVNIFTTNVSGDKAEIAAMQAGSITEGYEGHWQEQGIQMMNAAYDEATHQHLPLAKMIIIPGTVIAKANAAANAVN
jgi:ribose transport system substrate-binding protein